MSFLKIFDIFNRGRNYSFSVEKFSDNVYNYSFLINILLKVNNLELLNVIFENFIFFYNEFILKLLLLYKNKTVLSKSSLNFLVLNEKKANFNRQWYFSCSWKWWNRKILVYSVEQRKLIITKYLNKLDNGEVIPFHIKYIHNFAKLTNFLLKCRYE